MLRLRRRRAMDEKSIRGKTSLRLKICTSPFASQPSDQMAKAKDHVNHGGLSRQAIFQAVEASLKRLDTDYMDLLQIHRFDKDVLIKDTMEALHDLVRMGRDMRKLEHLGKGVLKLKTRKYELESALKSLCVFEANHFTSLKQSASCHEFLLPLIGQ